MGVKTGVVSSSSFEEVSLLTSLDEGGGVGTTEGIDDTSEEVSEGVSLGILLLISEDPGTSEEPPELSQAAKQRAAKIKTKTTANILFTCHHLLNKLNLSLCFTKSGYERFVSAFWKRKHRLS